MRVSDSSSVFVLFLYSWFTQYFHRKHTRLIKLRLNLFFITARVRSTREGNVLTCICVTVHTGGGPGQVPVPDGGGTPSSWWGRVPPLSWLGRVSASSHGGTPIWWLGSTPIWLIVGGGVPQLGLDGSTLPHRDWMGYPTVRNGWGYPPVSTGWGTPLTPLGDSSRASTCYVMGGMLLAFMQDDFLVLYSPKGLDPEADTYLHFQGEKYAYSLSKTLDIWTLNWVVTNICNHCTTTFSWYFHLVLFFMHGGLLYVAIVKLISKIMIFCLLSWIVNHYVWVGHHVQGKWNLIVGPLGHKVVTNPMYKQECDVTYMKYQW